MTINAAVIGSPIEHSMSPILHRAVYEKLSLPISYERVLVDAGSLAEFLAYTDKQALSVTMPLKHEAFLLASQRSNRAKLTQVVNSLVKAEGKWFGDNTDVFGITKALAGRSSFSKVLVIGSGATARSGLLALSENWPDAEVALAARNIEASADLVEFGESLDIALSKVELGADLVMNSDLVLSLVPAGALRDFWADFKQESLKPAGWLFDASYNPWPSDAASVWDDSRCVSGLEMLKWQAVAQIRFFGKALGFEVNLSDDEMYSIMDEAVASN